MTIPCGVIDSGNNRRKYRETGRTFDHKRPAFSLPWDGEAGFFQNFLSLMYTDRT